MFSDCVDLFSLLIPLVLTVVVGLMLAARHLAATNRPVAVRLALGAGLSSWLGVGMALSLFLATGGVVSDILTTCALAAFVVFARLSRTAAD